MKNIFKIKQIYYNIIKFLSLNDLLMISKLLDITDMSFDEIKEEFYYIIIDSLYKTSISNIPYKKTYDKIKNNELITINSAANEFVVFIINALITINTYMLYESYIDEFKETKYRVPLQLIIKHEQLTKNIFINSLLNKYSTKHVTNDIGTTHTLQYKISILCELLILDKKYNNKKYFIKLFRSNKLGYGKFITSYGYFFEVKHPDNIYIEHNQYNYNKKIIKPIHIFKKIKVINKIIYFYMASKINKKKILDYCAQQQIINMECRNIFVELFNNQLTKIINNKFENDVIMESKIINTSIVKNTRSFMSFNLCKTLINGCLFNFKLPTLETQKHIKLILYESDNDKFNDFLLDICSRNYRDKELTNKICSDIISMNNLLIKNKYIIIIFNKDNITTEQKYILNNDILSNLSSMNHDNIQNKTIKLLFVLCKFYSILNYFIQYEHDYDKYVKCAKSLDSDNYQQIFSNVKFVHYLSMVSMKIYCKKKISHQ